MHASKHIVITELGYDLPERVTLEPVAPRFTERPPWVSHPWQQPANDVRQAEGWRGTGPQRGEFDGGQ